MKMCQDHMDRLLAAVGDTQERAMAVLLADMQERQVAGEPVVGILDPLTAAYAVVLDTVANTIQCAYAQDPLTFMADSVDHPEWACPVCALNWCHAEHVRLCEQKVCDHPQDVDWTATVIDHAAVIAIEAWKATEDECRGDR